jgi:hypothetical protein
VICDREVIRSKEIIRSGFEYGAGPP